MDLRDIVTAEASDFTERLTAALTAQVDEAARHAQKTAVARASNNGDQKAEAS